MNALIPLAVFIGLIAIVILTCNFFAERKIKTLRTRGVYPEEGKETEADVLQLLHAGEKIMAIKCYRTLRKVSLKEAKEAVELLEKKGI